MATIRFFPVFRSKDTKHGGYLSFLLLSCLGGTLIVGGLMILFKDQIIMLFQNSGSDSDTEAVKLSNYLVEHFYWGLVCWFFINNFIVTLTSYATALKRPRVPSFLLEVGGRLVTLVLLVVYWFDGLTMDAFVGAYALKQIPVLLSIIGFLTLIGEFSWYFSKRIFHRLEFIDMRKFRFFAVFSETGGRLITNVDTIMISAILTMNETGIYSVFLLITTIIVMSHRGIARIVSPMLADYWQNKEIGKIQDLFQRMALNNTIVGVLIFVGIVVNLDNAVLFYGNRYGAGTQVAIFLGLGQLIHVLSGYCSQILIYSPKFRMELVGKLITVFVTIVTNLFFINRYGIVGAAMASALTLLVTNGFLIVYLYREYKLYPFSINMIKTLAVGSVVLVIGLYIPRIGGEQFLFDIVFRSLIVGILYGATTIYLRLSPDINQWLNKGYSQMLNRWK